MGLTLAEKILARASGRDAVAPGEFVVAEIDLAMAHDIFAAQVFSELRSAGVEKVWDPSRVAIVIDHLVPAPSAQAAELHRRIREEVDALGIEYFSDAGGGICHQLLAEGGRSRPGMLIVGTDSHTTTQGAVGAAGTGIGTSDMVYTLATGRLWFRVPETIRFEMTGALPDMITGKDVVLFIAGGFGSDVAQYRAIEFAGPAAAGMGMADRLTICNMAVEIGAKFGMFAADAATSVYLGGSADEFLAPDADAAYAAVHPIALSKLEPQVAVPHAVDRVVPVGEVEGTAIHQAFIGSCTNGRLEDLEVAADLLRGAQVHPKVRLLVAPASRRIHREAERRGLIGVLVEAGATILPPGCGPCFGGHGGLLAPGERCIGTHNRNFPGRMGSPQAEIYLASPATVAASAIAGCIADPRKVVSGCAR
ncbi:MAG: 3-isopropylmalate dehydratase large subunit [Acidobacteria bacterium]|nr:3-isopropylmalate dehydratase large subunit [Acidobacteriota bacterium]